MQRRSWIFAVMCAGIAIAWIDSRPTWDDTAVTAFAVLIVAASGSLVQVPFWLSAILAAGPLVVAEISGGPGVLMALPFAFVGACAGALLRRAIPSTQ